MDNPKNHEDDCKDKESPPEDIRVTRKTPSFSLLSDKDSVEDDDPESAWRGVDLSGF
jgi:hypothetical protein